MEEKSRLNDPTLDYYEANAGDYFASTVDINMTVLYVPFLLYLRPFSSILDAGCGSGRDALYFSRRGFRVTAFDYAPSLVKMASKLTGHEILNLSFQKIEFRNQFDGVWACASLMHVPMDEMHDVLSRLSRSMKVDAVMYASFKPEKSECYRNDRLFVDMDKNGFDSLIEQHPEMTILRYWNTHDPRPGMKKEVWLNVLIRKTRPLKKMHFLGISRYNSGKEGASPRNEIIWRRFK
jgi:SAM-dependent methyltransferase